MSIIAAFLAGVTLAWPLGLRVRRWTRAATLRSLGLAHLVDEVQSR